MTQFLCRFIKIFSLICVFSRNPFSHRISRSSSLNEKMTEERGPARNTSAAPPTFSRTPATASVKLGAPSSGLGRHRPRNTYSSYPL